MQLALPLNKMLLVHKQPKRHPSSCNDVIQVLRKYACAVAGLGGLSACCSAVTLLCYVAVRDCAHAAAAWQILCRRRCSTCLIFAGNCTAQHTGYAAAANNCAHAAAGLADAAQRLWRRRRPAASFACLKLSLASQMLCAGCKTLAGSRAEPHTAFASAAKESSSCSCWLGRCCAQVVQAPPIFCALCAGTCDLSHDPCAHARHLILLGHIRKCSIRCDAAAATAGKGHVGHITDLDGVVH